MEMPPPGWYEDPVGSTGLLRWWDGARWTDHTAAAPAGPASAAPAEVAAAEVPVAEVPVAEVPAAEVPAAGKWSAPPAFGSPSPAPAYGDDPDDEGSLTDWFESIPVPVLSRDEAAASGAQTAHAAHPALAAPTRHPAPRADPAYPADAAHPARPVHPGEVTTRHDLALPPASQWAPRRVDNGWAPTQADHWAPAPGAGNSTRMLQLDRPDAPILERNGVLPWANRNRRRLMWALALGTAVAVLAVVGLVILLGSGAPAHTAASAATRPPSAASKISPSPSAPATGAPSTTPTTGTPVTDGSSGLSYAMLATPWQAGCPAPLNNATFTWSGGESAVAGMVGSSPWYASACSGQLGSQYSYSGVADLETTAVNLVSAFDPAYYSGLPHTRNTAENEPEQVSGHPAWIVKFVMNYPTAASQGLAWQSELGAVVVVDRGTGQPPAVFYVTVPDNLGMGNVDAELQSLQLAAPAATTPPPTAPPTGPPGSAPPASTPAPPAGGGANP